MRRFFNQPVQDDPPPAPTQWEQFLAAKGILESGCPSLLQHQSPTCLVIRSWVLAHYKRRYVPEHVIQSLGLHRESVPERQSSQSITL